MESTIIGLYRDDGTEHGNYYNWGKKTQVHRVLRLGSASVAVRPGQVVIYSSCFLCRKPTGRVYPKAVTF